MEMFQGGADRFELKTRRKMVEPRTHTQKA